MRIPYHLPQYGPSSFHPLPPRAHPSADVPATSARAHPSADVPATSAGLKRKATHSPERGASPWHRQRLQDHEQERVGQDRVQQQQTKQEREKQCTLSSRDAPTTPSGGGSDPHAGAAPGVPSLDGGSRYLLTPADSHPAHFTRGSLIQLASGQMKKVEQLDTEDFLSSAAHSPEVGLAIFLKKKC